MRTFNSILKNSPSNLGALRSSLLRALRSEDYYGKSVYEESGRLNCKQLANLKLGRQDVFFKTDRRDEENSAVSLMIDLSGSMSDVRRNLLADKKDIRPIEVATETTVQLANIINKTSSTLSISGFNAFRKFSVFQFKNWAESLNARTKHNIANMKACVGWSTPVVQAYQWQLEDLNKVNAFKKIAVFITDDSIYSNEKKAMDHFSKMADQMGINVVIISIEADLRIKNSIRINNVADMGGVVMSNILKKIK